MSHFPKVHLTQPIEASLRGGNPWIFHDAVKHPRDLSDGDVVDVMDNDRGFLGRGIIEPKSPLRVRLWTLRSDVNIDNDLLEARIRVAKKRRKYPTHDTTGFRLSNGEGDRIPGLVIDIYGEVAVFRVDGRAAERWLQPAKRVVEKLLGTTHFAVRRSERYRDQHEPAMWLDGSPDGDVTFLEHGLTYLARPISGQKTGFFLDQRDNRVRVAEYAVGRRLLNLFGYSGGFSLAAAAKGAAYTCTVDLAQPALDDARRNFELNGIPSPAHGFEKADVFDYLGQFRDAAAPFDVIVCDPPSFAHRREDIAKASEAYVRLFSETFRVAHNDAVVAVASCSSQIGRELFADLVSQAAERAGVSYVVHGLYGAASDHVWPIGFPEADYLQFATGTVHRD